VRSGRKLVRMVSSQISAKISPGLPAVVLNIATDGAAMSVINGTLVPIVLQLG
jgi:hypothetical protein